MEIPKEISDMSEEDFNKVFYSKYGDNFSLNELPQNDPLVMEFIKRIETGE